MALGKLEQFELGTSFAGWMGRFVRNVALNHARKVQRRSTRPVAPEDVEELAADAPGGGARILAGPGSDRAPIDDRGVLSDDQAWFDDRVLAGLRELRPDQRATLLLRTILDLSFREISEVLGIPEGTAMSHVHRARLQLRARLTEDDFARAAREGGGS